MQLNNVGKYQRRLVLTIVLLIVISLLAWNGAFRKTIKLHKQINQLEEGLSSAAAITTQKQKIKSETERLNRILGISDSIITTEQIFDELIEISDSIGDVKIVNFPQIHEIVTNGYKIRTMPVGFEGDYFKLLSMIHLLERNKNTGRLVSVNFIKEKDYKKNKEYLSTTLLFQSYELIHPEQN